MPTGHDTTSPLAAKGNKAPAWITEIAAPAILIGGATAYFAGNVFHDAFLGKYGLKGAAIQWSVQQTIAYGYYALLRSLIPATIAVIAGTTLGYATSRLARERASPEGFIDRHRRYIVFVNMVGVTLAFMTFGYIAGINVAETEYRRVEQSIIDHCKSCFVYEAKKGQVVGLLIGQDEKVMLVATRKGLAIIPAGTIRSIRAINRAKPKSFWVAL